MSPWCLDREYGVFIHSGRETKKHAAAIDLLSSSCYHLLGLLQGRGRLVGTDGQARDILAPTIVLQRPAGDERVRIAMAASTLSLVFGVRQVPRHLMGGGAWGLDDTRQAQPDPVSTWGRDLPRIIPETLHPSGFTVLRRCNSLWWRSPREHCRANNLLESWLLDVLDAGDDDAVSDDWFEHLTRHCRRQLCHQVDTSEMAADLGISRQHLTVILKRRIGKTPGEFLRDLRTEEAIRLLRSTRLTITAVANHCGYSSARSFARAFRQTIGESPAAYRRKGAG